MIDRPIEQTVEPFSSNYSPAINEVEVCWIELKTFHHVPDK